MKLAMNASMRCAIVATVLVSWFGVSNHCVFAALATSDTGHYRQDADGTACPFHSKPAKQKGQSSPVQCCKILRALILEKTKSGSRDDAKFSDVDLRVELFVVFPQLHPGQPLLLDTGPPVAPSFAELILQRSLLAHAPPSLA